MMQLSGCHMSLGGGWTTVNKCRIEETHKTHECNLLVSASQTWMWLVRMLDERLKTASSRLASHPKRRPKKSHKDKEVIALRSPRPARTPKIPQKIK
eukprot:2283830-Amphidinium_carterae.1